MTEWKTYKLGDIADIQTGPFGSQLHNKDYALVGSPIVTVEHLGNRHFTTQNLPLVSDADKARLSKYILSEGDIVFSRVGSVDRCSYVSDKEVGWLFSGRCLRVRCNREVYPLYIYYYFCLESVKQYIRNVAVGATMPSINTQIMSEIPISLPSLEEQRRIAGILGAIDDKIENNRRINTNLELQAQALYKQWFVDNRKDDWEEKQLGEIALHITDGVHNTVIDSPNGEYYLLSCKNIKSGQLFIGSNERRIDHETFTKLRKRTRLSHGDILVTSVGTVGEMYLVNESPSNYEFQRSIAIIKPNNDIISSYFLYAALLYQQNEIKHLAHGAVQQCIFISDLKEYSLIVPNKDDISAFDAVVAPMFNKIGELQKENETLATLRDTLLPKLMNGEIKL